MKLNIHLILQALTWSKSFNKIIFP